MSIIFPAGDMTAAAAHLARRATKQLGASVAAIFGLEEETNLPSISGVRL